MAFAISTLSSNPNIQKGQKCFNLICPTPKSQAKLCGVYGPLAGSNQILPVKSWPRSWAICCYVFLVSLLCEGINVSNGVLMVNICNQIYEYMHTYKNNSFIFPFPIKVIIALANVVILLQNVRF